MTTKEQVLDMVLEEKNNAMSFYSHLRSLPEQSILAIEECYDNIYNRIQSEVHEPKIKQLEWNNEVAYKLDLWLQYQIDEEYGGGFVVRLNGVGKDNEPFDTLDQAKAYAQEHFENLIRGCYI